MPLSLKEELTRDFQSKTLVNLQFQHETGHRRPTNLDFEEESEGTQKFFALAGPWLDTLNSGHVAIVDELGNSLHPALVAFLVGRFHDPELNTKGAQLIFSTHDATILSQNRFRRDQIWFCERNSYQENTTLPLDRFQASKGFGKPRTVVPFRAIWGSTLLATDSQLCSPLIDGLNVGRVCTKEGGRQVKRNTTASSLSVKEKKLKSATLANYWLATV